MPVYICYLVNDDIIQRQETASDGISLDVLSGTSFPPTTHIGGNEADRCERAVELINREMQHLSTPAIWPRHRVSARYLVGRHRNLQQQHSPGPMASSLVKITLNQSNILTQSVHFTCKWNGCVRQKQPNVTLAPRTREEVYVTLRGLNFTREIKQFY